MGWKPSTGVRRLAILSSVLAATAWTLIVAVLVVTTPEDRIIQWRQTAVVWLAGSVALVVTVVGLTTGVAWVIDGFRAGKQRRM